MRPQCCAPERRLFALLPDPTRLVSGSKDGEICFWNTATTAALHHERETVRLPAKLIDWRFAPDSQSILSVDVQGQVAQWRGLDFKEEHPLFVIRSNFDHVCISEDFRWFASSSTNGEIEVWNVDKRTRWSEFKAHTNQVGLGRFLAHGRKLMIIHANDDSWHELETDTGLETRSWPGAHTKSSTCAFSPDDRWCLTLRSSRGSAPSARGHAYSAYVSTRTLAIACGTFTANSCGGAYWHA